MLVVVLMGMLVTAAAKIHPFGIARRIVSPQDSRGRAPLLRALQNNNNNSDFNKADMRQELLLRGGEEATSTVAGESSLYTTVGVQIIHNNGSGDAVKKGSSLWLQQFENSPSIMLLPNRKGETVAKPHHTAAGASGVLWDGNAAAVERLAMECQVMVLVVVVDDNSQQQLLDPTFVRALTRGLEERAERHTPSSVLVLLVSNSNKASTDNSWSDLKDHLVIRELASVTPAMVSSLDLLSLDDPVESTVGLASAWEGILEDHTIQKKEDAVVTESAPISDTVEDEQLDSSSSNLNIGGEEDETIQTILLAAKRQIRSLESQQELVWLGFEDQDGDVATDETQAAIHFGASADMIIQSYQSAVRDAQFTEESQEHAQVQRNLWQHVLPPLKQLYDQHLQFLREHYGTQYETALETTAATAIATATKEDYQEAWKQAAADITTAFRDAAQAAVPSQCRPGQLLRDANFDYVPVLEGLLSDMMVATEQQQDLLGMAADDDEVEEGVEEEDEERTGIGRFFGRRRRRRRQRNRPAKWYEKVAAKAFVFGVNYAQGWLAYQGIKRAAAQRDAHLPKFPLF